MSFAIALSLNPHTAHTAFASTQTTCLVSWDSGVVVGSSVGSVFLFRQSAQPAPRPQQPPSLLPSRAASPTPSVKSISPISPFSVAPRARIVSGITTEKVEAPKNYVDYDDEPSKLKNMLKGHPIREPTPKPENKRAMSPPPSRRQKDSAANAPKKPIITRVSHIEDSTKHGFALHCMVVLPHKGFMERVSDLAVLADGLSVAVLQESGVLSILSLQDGLCIASTDAHLKSINGAWIWSRIHILKQDQIELIFLSARKDERTSYSLNEQSSSSEAKIATLAYSSPKGILPAQLDAIGDFGIDGIENTIAFFESTPLDGLIPLFYINDDDHVIQRRIILRERQSTPATSDHGSEISSLSLHHAFKRINRLEAPSKHAQESTRVEILDKVDLGVVIAGAKGLRVSSLGQGIVWSANQVNVISFDASPVQSLSTRTVNHLVRVVHFGNESYSLLFRNRLEFYLIGSEPTPTHSEPISGKPALFIDKGDRWYVASAGSLEQIYAQSPSKPMRKWTMESLPQSIPRVTAVLPNELNEIVLGSSDGVIRKKSLDELFTGKAEGVVSTIPLGGYITSLFQVQDIRTNERLLIGGADDGSIAIWNTKTLELRANWTVFTTGLYSILHCIDQDYGLLQGCVLCISVDGTIAVIVLDGFQLLYLVPGSAFPLERLCIGGDNLLLVYSDDRARLWDIRTKEFWRSLTLGKAEELLNQGGWLDISINEPKRHGGILTPSLSHRSILEMNVERFISESATLARSISTSKIQTQLVLAVLDRLKAFLSTLITPGLNADIDQMFESRIGITNASVTFGTEAKGTLAVHCTEPLGSAWCISPDVSASRAFALILTLRALALFEEFADFCSTLTSFYATSLPQVVGSGYQPPSLIYLARRWFEGSNETKHVARMLFDAAATRLPDDEVVALVEHWQQYLPCSLPSIERESETAMLALFLCGHLAAEKYSILSASTLTDVSKSIATYMSVGHKALGIDLCGRGFHVWEHYIDSMDLLRSLFTLATKSGKDGTAGQARTAVLHIATTSTPTFMTTLGLDIMTPSGVEHRKSVLQIVAILIRKRPMVLAPNLPKLMEAVVKSLDPNSTTSREAVLDTATEILKHVVDTFSTVDFDMHSQRLAVGTEEGAVIMYDLKTATRLYVLEGHHRAIAATSFSHDGRRLVTVSIQEGIVLVWKVGSSFSNFFGTSVAHKPFKTFPFEGASDKVNVEWPGERSVRVCIGELVLTFNA